MVTLVTGGTGLVGNNVVRQLLARGEETRVLVREGSDPRPFEDLEVDLQYGDVRDPRAVALACEGVDRIIHAAGHVHIGWGNFDLHQAVNVGGTSHVAEAALKNDIRLVHVSSVDALGLDSTGQPADEDTPLQGLVDCSYVLTKRAAESALFGCIAKGLNAVIVNPGFMLGPWDWKPSSGRMLLAIASGQGVFAPPGGNDFADVRDVAAGILTALDRGRVGARYILGGEPLSYLEAWKLFAKVTGARPPRGVLPRWMLRIAGRGGDAWTRISGNESDVNSAATAMSELPHHFSSARAVAELDFQPRPAAEAAQGAWQWFCEWGYAKRRSAGSREMAPA